MYKRQEVHYAKKGSRIFMPKQQRLDDLVWLLYRGRELGTHIDPHMYGCLLYTSIEYDHACSDMEIRDISLQITDFLNRSGATSTSFVISFPKTVLTRQVETDVGDWKRGERNLYGLSLIHIL